MCALPLLGQFRFLKEWAGALEIWFRELHQYHISGIFDKMIELLKSDGKAKDKETDDFIFTELNRDRMGNQ